MCFTSVTVHLYLHHTNLFINTGRIAVNGKCYTKTQPAL